MKILIDVAHPAHIHYFRNFSNILEANGHECLYTLRDRGIIVDLANYYKINYKIRSHESKSKIKYMLNAFYNVYKIAKEFQPDIFIDAGTVIAAPISKLLRKPYIAIEDTEIANKAQNLFLPFTDVIFTPDSFSNNLGKKQINFKGLLELLYLHKNYFKKDISLISPYITDVNNFVLVRFVSWEAHHDVGMDGISFENKIKFIEYLSEKCDIIISSEGKLPDNLQKYAPKFPPSLMHNVLAQAKLVISEGSTTATEASLLGTPSVLISPLARHIGSLRTLQNEYEIQFHFDSLEEAMPKIEQLISDDKVKETFKLKLDNFTKDNIDVTALLVWFVKNYPKSFKILKEDLNYMDRFKVF